MTVVVLWICLITNHSSRHEHVAAWLCVNGKLRAPISKVYLSGWFLLCLNCHGRCWLGMLSVRTRQSVHPFPPVFCPL